MQNSFALGVGEHDPCLATLADVYPRGSESNRRSTSLVWLSGLKSR